LLNCPLIGLICPVSWRRQCVHCPFRRTTIFSFRCSGPLHRPVLFYARRRPLPRFMPSTVSVNQSCHPAYNPPPAHSPVSVLFPTHSSPYLRVGVYRSTIPFFQDIERNAGLYSTLQFLALFMSPDIQVGRIVDPSPVFYSSSIKTFGYGFTVA